MNAGQIYEIVIGSVMIASGLVIIGLRFDFGVRFLSPEKRAKATEWRQKNPALLAIVGPSILLIGIAQVIHQF